MPIPFYGQTGTLLLTVLIGGVLTTAAVCAWKQKFAERKEAPIDTVFNQREGEPEQSLFAPILGTIGALVFLVGGGLIFYWITAETSQFRSLPISQVRGFKVSRISEEGKDAPVSVLIEDREVAQNALEKLRGCTIFQRNREKFSDGFRIELLFDDESTIGNKLSVFLTITPSKGEYGIVVPRGPAGTNLGDYSCPEFHIWVQANIVPRFPAPVAN